jgi:hypothetical protein
MADASEESTGNDKHNWNPLANYLFLHEKHLEDHPIVQEAQFEVTYVSRPDDNAFDGISMSGFVVCTDGVLLEFEKSGEIEKFPPRRVRMNLYRYNAWIPGGHNVLRYDNMHIGEEHVYHRHLYDHMTGQPTETSYMRREEFPVLHEILDEIMELIPPV